MKCKSLEQKDYDEIRDGLGDAASAYAWLIRKKLHVALPHRHRFWEYGSGLQMVRAMPPPPEEVLDVGAGHSLLGPAVSLAHKCNVTEVDPSANVALTRHKTCEAVRARTGVRYDFCPQDFLLFDADRLYDTVFCISVIEHVPEPKQEAFWHKLASLVAPSGLLFVTCDHGEDKEKKWTYDEDRPTKPGPQFIEQAAEWLCQDGLKVGPIDTTYHGPEVFEYSFFRLWACKKA